MHVRVYLKGWRDSNLYSDAVNKDDHSLHDVAYREFLRSFQPYQPGDAVYLAIEYNDDDCDGDLAIAERAFMLFNEGSVNDARVAEYRGARHRSLSVGDVVEIDGRAYTVASFGFDRLDVFLRP